MAEPAIACGQLRVLCNVGLAFSVSDYRFHLRRFLLRSITLPAARDPRVRKSLLLLSIGVNGGALLFFKYFNFFVSSATGLLEWIGLPTSSHVLQIVLPVGISFYTFQTMCYTIDVYRGKLTPAANLLDYALYISYFPQLVAGPIERATNLLPQILNPRTVTPNACFEGTYLILWGFFKKVVVADNLCRIADWGFGNVGELNTLSALVTIYAFAWQIYCDFSGYTDIARGCSKLLGIELMVNFNVPYLSKTPSEFWRRWHISLSSWFTDYVFIPLGGSRNGTWASYRNIFITMLLSGLWHGAAWTFVAWGFPCRLTFDLSDDRYGTHQSIAWVCADNPDVSPGLCRLGFVQSRFYHRRMVVC